MGCRSNYYPIIAIFAECSTRHPSDKKFIAISRTQRRLRGRDRPKRPKRQERGRVTALSVSALSASAACVLSASAACALSSTSLLSLLSLWSHLSSFSFHLSSVLFCRYLLTYLLSTNPSHKNLGGELFVIKG